MRELKTHESKLPPYPIQNWFTSKLKAAAVAQGRSDLISLWAGQSAPLISHHHAEALLKSLYAETDRCIAKFTSSKKEH